MSVMEHRSTLGSVLEFHRARLAALDNWSVVQETMAVTDSPVRAISRLLGVTELGAHSVIAMLRAQRPERAEVAQQVEMLERLQEAAESRNDVRRRCALARSAGRRVLV